MKINIGEWKPFIVGDLFDIHPTKAYSMKNAQLMDNGDSPVVVNSAYNNGIGGYTSQPVTEIGGIITFSDTTTADALFYQPDAFVGYPHVQGMYPVGKYADRWNDLRSLFFVTAFKKSAVLHGFDYAYKFTREIASQMSVMLPVDGSNEPDWNFMDLFMSQAMRNAESSLDVLEQSDNEPCIINVFGWKEFVIGNLFEKLDLKILKPDFNKATDVSEVQSEEFCIPLVNAKHGNNGVMFYGRESDFETAEMTIDIVQNGAIATGDVYAQPQKTGVLWDAYLIKPKANITSALTLQFLATVIEKTIKDRFSYDNKCVWDKAKLLSVSLPVTQSGEPDWDYMDKYMMKMTNGVKENLNTLEQVQ